MFWCILVFFNHHSLMRVILFFRGCLSEGIEIFLIWNFWWVRTENDESRTQSRWTKRISDCSVFILMIFYIVMIVVLQTQQLTQSSQKDKLDRSVMSKSQNAPVTDQDKLDRSVISKDHTGNRKLNLEMVDRSML
jgi:hypothetical protein